jgi:energy-coupling factor transport system substrate-specific component
MSALSSAATDRPALRVGWRPALALAIASTAGLAMFLWPLLFTPPAEFSHNTDASFIFVVIMPAVLAVVLAELHSGGMDTKALAMLGVLSALGAALRPMGAGVAGIEPMFFLLVLAGRVYGPGFGFVLGNTTLFASALLTGGVGPWLPFQMLAAAWVGLGAGLLPRARGRAEIALLAGYAAVSAFAFGLLMNMWFWPYAIGGDTQLSYVAGDAVLSNLHRFVLFTLATSTIGWDLGRAITNALLVLLLGPVVLATLRRATRRAAFEAPVTFEPAAPGAASGPAPGSSERDPDPAPT